MTYYLVLYLSANGGRTQMVHTIFCNSSSTSLQDGVLRMTLAACTHLGEIKSEGTYIHCKCIFVT